MAKIISVEDLTGKISKEELYKIFEAPPRTWEEEIEIQEALCEYEKEHGEIPLPFTPVIKKEINTQKILIFGMNIGSIGVITKRHWEEFKASEITPRFPGFTEREVKGYWEGQPEDSIEIIIACPDRRRYERKLNEIREAYCKRFQQDSVMKINQDNTVEF